MEARPDGRWRNRRTSKTDARERENLANLGAGGGVGDKANRLSRKKRVLCFFAGRREGRGEGGPWRQGGKDLRGCVGENKCGVAAASGGSRDSWLALFCFAVRILRCGGGWFQPLIVGCVGLPVKAERRRHG